MVDPKQDFDNVIDTACGLLRQLGYRLPESRATVDTVIDLLLALTEEG